MTRINAFTAWGRKPSPNQRDQPAALPSETILWNFGNGSDGQNPQAGLVADAQGNLYGTTNKGDFDETTGGFPHGASGGDANGNLYGFLWFVVSSTRQRRAINVAVRIHNQSGIGLASVGAGWISAEVPQRTFSPGAADDRRRQLEDRPAGAMVFIRAARPAWGAVFELNPPASADASWTESVLWSFGANSTDGLSPQAPLLRDAAGNLFGTTANGGAYGQSSSNAGYDSLRDLEHSAGAQTCRSHRDPRL